MYLLPMVAVARFLESIPGWAIGAYLLIAAVMATVLLTQFLKNARVRHGSGNAWLVLLILFFPLMALSIIWPITMPFAIRAVRKERRSPPTSGAPLRPRA
ncbi:hypothetical protein [Humisphaera borealis]|uniref:DUF805 domain-containing protein n=1 Tax=Humisphaera borealis TaxID=2807512 RepID=A0A7M2WU90_9BACT|nr:hypothetical protein [Humisphaera borealis]QOV88834.1 hypothetical protein IPV69_21805 [Humisphaera borealis]